MSPDATINSIRDGLSIEYVRRVLDAMWECKRDFGNAWLAIRVDDRHHEPDYRTYAVMNELTGKGMVADARSGRTHRIISVKADSTANWSTQRSSLDDVMGLIGELRSK